MKRWVTNSTGRTGRRSPRPAARAGGGSILLTIALVLLASPRAEAVIRVYVDSPNVPRALPIGTTTIPLSITNGTAPTSVGSACLDGDGDELCGFNLRLEATGGVELVAFTPDAPTTISKLEPGLLRVNGVSPLAGRLGPERIGTLQVSVSGPGQVELTPDGASTGVGADLSLRLAPSAIVALPEPTLAAGLTAGVVLLGAHAAARERRASRVASRRRASAAIRP